MFYFQHLLDLAMNGIDSTRVIPTITNMAFAILLIGFLVGLYQAAMRGGDSERCAHSFASSPSRSNGTVPVSAKYSRQPRA